MNSKQDHIPEVERETEQILELLEGKRNILSFKQKILSFFYKYSRHCYEYIAKSEFKSCLFILLKIQSLCLTILQKTLSAEKSQINTIIRDVIEIFERHQTQSEVPSFRIGDYFSFVKSQMQTLTLELQSNEITKFCLEVIYILSMTLNNLGSIYKLRNNSDKAVRNFCAAVDLMMALDKLLDAYQTFSFLIAFINSIHCVEIQDDKLEDVSQVVCNAVLYVEKLESKIDGMSNKGAELYEKFEFASQFILLLQMDSLNAPASTFLNVMSESKSDADLQLAKMSLASTHGAVIRILRENSCKKQKVQYLLI